MSVHAPLRPLWAHDRRRPNREHAERGTPPPCGLRLLPPSGRTRRPPARNRPGVRQKPGSGPAHSPTMDGPVGSGRQCPIRQRSQEGRHSGPINVKAAAVGPRPPPAPFRFISTFRVAGPNSGTGQLSQGKEAPSGYRDGRGLLVLCLTPGGWPRLPVGQRALLESSVIQPGSSYLRMVLPLDWS